MVETSNRYPIASLTLLQWAVKLLLVTSVPASAVGGAGVGVGGTVGVAVAVGAGVGLGVGERCPCPRGVGVGVKVAVAVAVGVKVAVAVGVADAVEVAVALGVAVGVGVGDPQVLLTNASPRLSLGPFIVPIGVLAPVAILIVNKALLMSEPYSWPFVGL